MRIRGLVLLLALGACEGSFIVTTPPGAPDAPTAPTSGDLAAWARATFEREVVPLLSATCQPCHASPDGNGWMQPRPDIYTSMIDWPLLVDTATPTASQLLTRGLHEGPALTAAPRATVLRWIQQEQLARTSLGATASGSLGRMITETRSRPSPASTAWRDSDPRRRAGS